MPDGRAGARQPEEGGGHPETAKHLEGSVAKIKVAAIARMVLGGITGVVRLLLL
jgi:hypothetical protein